MNGRSEIQWTKKGHTRGIDDEEEVREVSVKRGEKRERESVGLEMKKPLQYKREWTLQKCVPYVACTYQRELGPTLHCLLSSQQFGQSPNPFPLDP